MFQSILKEQLQVPARIEFLGQLRDFVTKVGHRHGFSERVINAFKLSIDEAATNIIKHAYRDWEGSITIRAIVKKNSLTIVLVDQGKYFDPRQVSDPDLQRYVDIGKKGGLGIFIMRRLLDEIDYRKTEEGNELWMVKHRDVARKQRFTLPALSMTLKARYWLFSTAVLTLILAGVYLFNFFRSDDVIVNDYLARGRAALSLLASDVSANLQQQVPESSLASLRDSTNLPDDLDILAHTLPPVNTLQNSEYRDILYRAFIVDNNQYILASTDPRQILEAFTRPVMRQEFQKDVSRYLLPTGERVLDISYPVADNSGRTLCTAHFFIDYAAIGTEIAAARWSYMRITLVVWLGGAIGLFLLIILVMNPFRRLSEWVKELGQPGVANEMDIDTSTEIGEIAQAFSDITLKLRESQVNLAEQERLQKEMQVAQEIQQTLLPGDFPEIEGYGLASYYAAAKEVGGDYYDFVEVDKDTLGIVVADVSGKGVPGSLVMTMIRTALRTEARGIKDAAEVLARVNEFVVNDMKKGMFVTLFYVIIDSKRRRLNYASAGHNPMILFRASLNKTYYLNPHGFPIGISLPDKNLFRSTIESDTLSLNEGDILLMYTDGVTEAMNRRRHLYGEERFLNVIREHGHLAADEFVTKLHDDLNTFTEGTPQSDDITLVVIKEKSTADKIELERAKRVYRLIQQGKSIREACEQEGLSSYAYYSKYKELFEQGNVEEMVPVETESIELKHLSIEEKTRLYDVIMRFPEFGAKKICEELNTERYGFTELSPARIYDELVRSKLNTRELREAFVHRGGKKRRPKAPGTPMLTLDGRVIIQKGGLSDQTLEPEPEEIESPTPFKSRSAREKPAAPARMQKVNMPASSGRRRFQGRDILSYDIDELLDAPLEDLFDKRIGGGEEEADAEPLVLETVMEETPPAPAVVEAEAVELEMEPPRGDFALDELGFGYAESGQGDQPDDAEMELPGADVVEQSTAGSAGLLPESGDLPQADIEAEVPPPTAGESAVKPDFPEIDIHAEELPGLSEPGDWPEPRDWAEREQGLADDLDFADLIQSGGGIDDPLARAEEADLFADPTAEEAQEVQPLHENPAELDSDMREMFEEFLDLDDEAGLIAQSGELESDIAEQILQSEIAARISHEEDENATGGDGQWQLHQERLPVVETPRVERQRLSFDELIELLSAEKEGKETWQNMDGGGDVPKDDGAGAAAAEERGFFDDPEYDRLLANAQSCLLNEEYRRAIDLGITLVDRYGENGRLRGLLGQAYFRLHAYRESAREFQQLLRIEPQNQEAHEKLGIIFANQGAFPVAIAHWEHLLELAPERRDIRESIQRARQFIDQTEAP